MKQKSKFKKTEIGMIPEDWEVDEFVEAINFFLAKESFLLENNLNERTIPFKLAEYLQKEYDGKYNVDCEYNRVSKDDKNMDKEYITKTLQLDIEKIKTNNDKGPTVFPDIIIHERRINDNNFLVIEIKLENNKDGGRKLNGKEISSKDFDIEKLKKFTTELKYEHAIYLEFNKEDISDIKFFQNGEEVVNETRN
jgi:hypothetical protein